VAAGRGTSAGSSMRFCICFMRASDAGVAAIGRLGVAEPLRDAGDG
jgi:hypothetical protein